MPSAAHQLSGLRKSAMVLLSLDSETAGRLIDQFPEGIAGALRAEMKRMRESADAPPDVRRRVLEEFLRGAGRFSNLPVQREITPAPPAGLSGGALAAKSIHAGDHAMATILESTVAAIEDRMSSDEGGAGGEFPSHSAVDVMSRLERMPDRAILAIVEQLDSDVIVLALRGAGRSPRTKVLSNMAPGHARQIATRLAGQRPAALRDIESAHQRVAEVVFRLESAGEIDPAPARPKEDRACP